MKTLFALLLALSIALTASAHPGKTDRHGGHQCLKDCAEWDLFYREYHGHDKDGRPVRIAKKKQASPPAPVPVPVTAQAVAVAATAAAPPAVVSAVPVEPGPSMLLWLLLALCLALFLVVRRGVRDAEDRS